MKRRALVAAVLACVSMTTAALASAPVAAIAETTPRLPARSTAKVIRAAPAMPSRTPPVLFGLGEHTDADLSAAESLLGKRPVIFGSFATKTNSPIFWGAWARSLRSRGMVPMLAWDPTPHRMGDAHSRLASVLRGEHDAYIRSWARQVSGYGHPVLVRLWAEMNGRWEPYSPLANGNRPSEFIPAYRHVVDVARAAGARNILWVWNPNRFYSGCPPYSTFYPGDRYVDWVGLDLYNWNGLQPHGPDVSFAKLMASSLPELRKVAPRKPLMLPELGVNEGASKPAWLREMFTTAGSYGVKALVYFDYAIEGADWRFRSSPAAARAARAAVDKRPIAGAQDLGVETVERYLVGWAR